MLVVSSIAQQSATEQAVIQLFEKPEKIEWLKHYKGRIDDLNDVAVTLAFDGKRCKGQLLYLRSQEKFGLSGYIKDQQILLHEIDREEAISGFFEGHISGSYIFAEWSNFDNSIGGDLLLKETSQLPKLPTHCGRNKWIRSFRGNIDNESVELLLQKEGDHIIRGLAYFNKYNQSFEVNGEVDHKNAAVLHFTDNFGNRLGHLRGTITKEKIVDPIYTSPEGEQSRSGFWFYEKFDVGCVEYADYISSYDLLYPKTRNKTFNEWITNITDEWISQCRQQVYFLNKKNRSIEPELRATARAYGWCDLDLISIQVISGIITLGNTWNKETNVHAFNFDLYTGEAITLESLFQDDFNWNTFVRNQVSKQIVQHAFYNNEAFRKWLKKEPFDQFTIRKEGLHFRSSYNSIYGQQSITIPFKDLKPYLKKDTPLNDLMH